MAFISSAPASKGNLRPSQQSTRPNIKVAQNLAKQKSLEKKSQNYKLPLAELAIFTQQLASLLTAGLPLVQCLEALAGADRRSDLPHHHPGSAHEISAGNSFSVRSEKIPEVV
ncbi:MAG: hypothetical protein QM760_20110 [Nibricoccus sp.]